VQFALPIRQRNSTTRKPRKDAVERLHSAGVTIYYRLQDFRVNVIFSRAIMRACPDRLDTIMQTPVWIQPALYGAGVGAIALAFVGFTWGGWVTGGTARQMVESSSIAAVASSLTPYCIEQSRNDPRSVEILAELKGAKGYNGRMVIEKAGWATPIGAEKPNTALAQACQTALSSS
jgi:outer membrane lipoprotein SlyB